jgi:hypothetical protein
MRIGGDDSRLDMDLPLSIAMDLALRALPDGVFEPTFTEEPERPQRDGKGSPTAIMLRA